MDVNGVRARDSQAGPKKSSFELDHIWQTTPEARGVINALLSRNRRKSFGLLEKPLFDQNYPLLFRRLFLVGKSGVGKTATVHKLLGRDIPCIHEETLGIQTTTLYWPVKVVDPPTVMVAKLEFWDVGEKMLKQFDHILPTCQQSTDGTLFFFSFTDRHSWDSLPQLFTSILGALPTPDTFNLVIGTHADSPDREVSERELERFQARHRVIALPASNVNTRRHPIDQSAPDGRAGIEDITKLVNDIVEVMLAYEKRKAIMSGNMKESSLSAIEYFISTLPLYMPHS